ncbi:unnamed protein product [Ilex paraguariensis]|uniref:Lysine-specific demethylase REF6 n=1 Tax=Ilex paraguariensis TaxID=185542 RepID=A0ABC8REU1_9AQUA
MASAAEQPSNIEVFSWLKNLPVAPEYHPTLAEFEDPIGYIFKIEKEASNYGICKIVPPVPAPPKKTAISYLNKSLAARSSNSNPKSTPTFTTRQQQIGFCPRKHRPVQKPVWQSGEQYTLNEFEAKAKSFERNYLKKAAKKALSALEIETLYWKATVDKPFSVEYANDMPGSAFVPLSGKKSRETGEAVTVGETEWNMRGVSRAKGSLLRFMKDDIPGVTSPMVYIAMLFSWFAWHVEDHDLHSLNYLHTGTGKTWYGVPREAAIAFEEVIRVHGYGGEINPLVTCATLGEKVTVMSPEVLLGAGVPCCRLVQNAGEFVVTFPRAYHSGFSHGFNCGEAANIATPGWLRVAKDAAIRRASINCPPMVSHFQLLYDLALSLCSRVPKSISKEPRSSRLKDKKKGDGDTLVKELFIHDLMHNNDLLHVLGKGSSVVLLPQNFVDNSACSNLHVGSQLKVKPRFSLGLCSPDDDLNDAKGLLSDDILLDTKQCAQHLPGFYSTMGRFSSFCAENNLSLLGRSNNVLGSLASQTQNLGCERERTARCDRLSDQGLFSCVTCGILCYACVAIVQPSEAASRYLMSTDCSVFGDCGISSDGLTAVSGDANASELDSCSGWKLKRTRDGLFEVPIESTDQIQTVDEIMGVVLNTEAQHEHSSLGLLALTYDSSDSEEDLVEADIPNNANKPQSGEHPPESTLERHKTGLHSLDCFSGSTGFHDLPFPRLGCGDEVPPPIIDPYGKHVRTRASFKDKSHTDPCIDYSSEDETCNIIAIEANSLRDRFRHQIKLPHVAPSCFAHKVETVIGSAIVPVENTTISFASRSDEDSSRMHVFCLQHAVEVEHQLRSIGGSHILLLCHSDYPKLETEAKLVAQELGTDYLWSDIAFREASEEDEERMQSALNSEAAIHGNGDWAVKLGINLYYSVNLSRSHLYCKQMPFNSIIYNAFGRSSQANTSMEPELSVKGSSKHKKIAVAGKWCGKVWMSNQVHFLLAERNHEEQEQERRIPAQAKPMKLERISEGTHLTESGSAASKTGTKRKNRVESRSIIKAKSPKTEDPDKSSDESPEDDSHQEHKRILRNKRMKNYTPLTRSSRQGNTRSVDSYDEDELDGGPSTRLRTRIPKPTKELEFKRVRVKQVEAKPVLKQQPSIKKGKKAPAGKVPAGNNNKKTRGEEGEYPCDMEGCTMSFGSKQELVLHKRNICPVKGCGKKFFSHKYLVQHRRVHVDDRPLKCPWKGCKMTFKWAWARTEHIRVHTGARPYICTVAGCGQTFRFVSDFSRHKRKTGHSPKKGR